MSKKRERDLASLKSKYQKNPEHYRAKSKRYAENNREKTREACRKWRAKNPHKQKAACDSWNLRNPDKIKAANIRRRPRVTFLARVRKYGMSEAEMREFLDTHAFCEICGGEGQHVDHSHKNGKVRGMLCKHCNMMLGNATDNPAVLRMAIIYLEERGR